MYVLKASYTSSQLAICIRSYVRIHIGSKATYVHMRNKL